MKNRITGCLLFCFLVSFEVFILHCFICYPACLARGSYVQLNQVLNHFHDSAAKDEKTGEFVYSITS